MLNIKCICFHFIYEFNFYNVQPVVKHAAFYSNFFNFSLDFLNLTDIYIIKRNKDGKQNRKQRIRINKSG